MLEKWEEITRCLRLVENLEHSSDLEIFRSDFDRIGDRRIRLATRAATYAPTENVRRTDHKRYLSYFRKSCTSTSENWKPTHSFSKIKDTPAAGRLVCNSHEQNLPQIMPRQFSVQRLAPTVAAAVVLLFVAHAKKRGKRHITYPPHPLLPSK